MNYTNNVRKSVIIGLNIFLALIIIGGALAPVVRQGLSVSPNSVIAQINPIDGSTNNPGGNGSTNNPGGNGSTNNPGGNGSTNNPGGNGSTNNPGSNGSTNNPGVVNPLSFDNICELMSVLVNLATEIGAIIGVFFIIWAGFLFVEARGNEAKLKKAKSVLWTTLIGICILLGATLIAKVIIGTIASIIGPAVGTCGTK